MNKEEYYQGVTKPALNQRYSNWLKLKHYFEHELTEGEITDKTYLDMADCLEYFKPEVK